MTGRTPGGERFEGVLAAAYEFLLSFGVFAMLGCGLFLAVLAVRDASWRERAALAAILVAGLVVRLRFATLGPGDLSMNLEDVYLEWFAVGNRLGDGAIAFFRTIFRVLPRGDETIAYTNVALGTFLPLLAHAYLRLLDVGRSASLLASAGLALMPVLIVFSGNCSRQMLFVVLMTAALAALARYQRGGRLAFLALSGLGIVSVVGVRPDGILVLAFWALQAAFLFRGEHARLRPLVAALAAMALPIAGMLALADNSRLIVEEVSSPGVWLRLWLLARNLIVLNTEYTPVVAVGAGLVGLGVGLSDPARRRVAAFAGLALLTYGVAYAAMTTYPRQLTDGRYQAGAYVFLAILGAVALESLGAAIHRSSWRRAVTAVLGVAALLSFANYTDLLLPHDLDEEARFLRNALPTLPRDTLVYYSDPNEAAICPGEALGEPLELGLSPPFYLGRAVGRPDIQWMPWPPRPEHGDRPKVYYAMANCLAIPQAKYYEILPNRREADWMGPDLKERFRIHECRCEKAMELLGDNPIVQADLPGRSWSRVRYSENRVPVGLYAIRPEDVLRVAAYVAAHPCMPRRCPPGPPIVPQPDLAP